jgi:tRNA nucleotidyltransferase/poly(A) polymerase
MSKELLRELVKEMLFEEVRRKFAMNLPDDLVALAHVFKRAGHQLYVVGGAVRDALQGKEPKDYDVTTDAIPDVVVELLKGMGGNKVLEVGKSFGVVVCVTPEGNEYEIATFRQDIGKGRRPEAVEFTSIENDVKRRDLTMNAVFYDIDAGEIVDYVGGIADIENGVVKAVGNPKERFDEDRLRILRALRFAGRMGSDLDPSTSKAIEDDNSLQGVSPERIRDEFLKGVKSAINVGYFLGLIKKYELWSQVLPGMRITYVHEAPRDPSTLLALLLSTDNDPTIVGKKLNALKYPANESSQAAFLVRFQGLDVNSAYRLRKLADSCHITDEQMTAYAREVGMQRNLLNAFPRCKPTVNGNAVMAAGFSGAQVGKELERQETELFKELVGA